LGWNDYTFQSPSLARIRKSISTSTSVLCTSGSDRKWDFRLLSPNARATASCPFTLGTSPERYQRSLPMLLWCWKKQYQLYISFWYTIDVKIKKILWLRLIICVTFKVIQTYLMIWRLRSIDRVKKFTLAVYVNWILSLTA